WIEGDAGEQKRLKNLPWTTEKILKKGSKIYHDYFQKFYDEVFFPTLEKENISMVFDLGDKRSAHRPNEGE
ncbi:MAG: hypothetical protein EBW56_06755, partial [Burkholderiaceae bacterium]|nr:hypothetical protein [Burkholderiaceae bacterium]